MNNGSLNAKALVKNSGGEKIMQHILKFVTNKNGSTWACVAVRLYLFC